MRIAIVTDTYLPQVNGVVTAEQLLRRELERQGHEVFVIAPSYGGEETPERHVYRVWSAPFPTRETRENRLSLRVPVGPRFDWDKERVDLIHSQVEATMGSHALYWAARHRLPHVHTYHTLWSKYVHYAGIAAPLFARWVHWRTHSFCNACQRVIAPSTALRDHIVAAGVRVPVEVIPTGTDAGVRRQARPRAEVAAELGIPTGRRVLGFVGRFAAEKNMGFLLDALLRLVARGVDAHLVLVGDGPGRPALEAAVDAAGLRGRVSFTGYVARERTFDYYGLSEVFVFSSLTETQGLVLLEAMSEGVPVVALSAMGVAELMADGRGGLTVCPGDLEGFSAAVERLLADRELHEAKAREGRLKAADWSIEATTKRVVACYERAIADYGRR
jgi:1,2-diacylglycerol 3-alpha-glucosyltransferase